MKKILVSTIAAVLSIPAFANEHHHKSMDFGLSPYVAMRLGAGYSNLNFSHNSEKENMIDEGLQGRLAMGVSLCSYGRTELEWSIFTKAKDRDNFGSTNEVDVDTKLQTLLWNNYMDIGHYKMIRPFIGVGAGVGMVNISVDDATAGINTDKDYTRFSAMGTMGLSFDMHDFVMDVAGRYTYVDVASGLHNFGADIGIRYMF